jgi:formate hydrogenlyase subunit 6/NADH:ubiquinone oxidoreductase subunit I
MAHGWSGCEVCGGACAWEFDDDEDEREEDERCRHPEDARVHYKNGVACGLCDTILIEPDSN